MSAANQAIAGEATPPTEFNQFTTAALALQSQPPRNTVRMVSLAICAMTGIALVFAILAKMDIVVTVQGKVIPSGKSKVVQSLESGVVHSIAVRDGQSVKAGEVLVELDSTSTEADQRRLQREVWEADADVLRAQALLSGRLQLAAPAANAAQPDMPSELVQNQNALLQSKWQEQRAKLAALDADIAKRHADTAAIATNLNQLSSSLPLIAQKNTMREELSRTGHVARTAVLESQLELMNAQKEQSVQTDRLKESRASYQAATEQRAQAVAEFRARASTELMEAIKRRDAASQEWVKARQRRALQTLRSPIDGTVQQLAVTTLGGVVTAAQPLLTIVPENTALEIEAQVMNRDVGHLKPGQRVINKVETFDFTRYGYIEGEVQWVGTDAIQDQKLGLVYPVRIRMEQLNTPNTVLGRQGVVSAGMSVTSDVRTGERRLIEYLLAPMLRYKQEALRER